ncbi:hypothetical protein B0H14DRAFT_2583221 [Mycena olivaceomarginata]|nr:hypothetical protein B0H14DRAFT_2583221 [Mycena olivaceomarginata]
MTYAAPASALALPRLIPPRSSGSNSDSAQSKKLKLKAKERKPAHASLRKFRKKLRVDEQLAGRFRHHPPSLFLPSSLQDTILDQLLSFASSSDLLPLLNEWYHRDTHTDSLFEVIQQIQADINQKREEARKETNRKARATRKAKKRKAAAVVSDSEEADEPDSEYEAHDDDSPDEHEPSRSESPPNDPFPAALLPKPKSRGRKRQALEEVPTNTSTRRPREPLQKVAEVSKDYGPAYRARIRR